MIRYLAGLLVFIVGFSCSPSNEHYPNVILLMADDMGWGDAGYNGHPLLQTPNLDHMASEGLVVSHFYAASLSICRTCRS